MPDLSVESGKNATPAPEAVRAELATVLNSAGFKRSARHSKFLAFVCETTLRGDAAKLNEYLIAHEVFERGEDYSPGEDSVVRRQAYSLRQKLQDYYSTDGAQDAVRIELPLGRYVPNFIVQFAPNGDCNQPLDAQAADVSQTSSPVPAQADASRQRFYVWMIAAALAGIGLFALGWAIGSRHKTSSPGAALAEIWGDWLKDPQGAMLCFSNPFTTVIQRIDKPFSPSILPRRISVTEDQDKAIREQLALPAGGYLYLSPGIGHAKMGEALGSVTMTAFFVKAGVPVSVTQSRFLSWEDFRSKNLILLGHDEANRWLDVILGKLPFRLAPTEADKPRRIVNTKPLPGEASEYSTGFINTRRRLEDYALVSMISGMDGRHRLLLINGVNTEGTEIAQEFLTDEISARELLSALKKAAPGHKGVWHFQAVMHSEVRDNVPTRVVLVAVRVL
jgi:hypothetical protein